MSQQMAERFIEVLRPLEADKDVEPLAFLCAAEAEVGNVIVANHFHGPDGARQF